jgi:uncharacterized protein (TIGR03435 family)
MPKLAILLLLAASALHAQTPATPAPDALAFEVAAIKPNNTGSGNSSSDTDNGLFTATNESLKNLMQWDAYGIPASRILGGPKWLDSARFDIRAKLDEATAAKLDKLSSADRHTADQAIFQQLLADRFGLKVHWETRELPIYALVPIKSGAKIGTGLKPVKDPNAGVGISTNGHNSIVDFKATSVTLADLAQALTSSAQDELGRDVVDQTNIQGKFDIALTWTRESNRSGPSDANAPETGPTLFTAIQEQLGLKLESSKGPVKVLVVDEANLPTDN